MEKKTRIERIARGEKVLQVVISEPLQEEWDGILQAEYEHQDVQEEIQEKYSGNDGVNHMGCDITKLSPEDAKKLFTVHQKVKMARMNFWRHVHEAYNTWNINVGVRDGYALVQIPERKGEDGGFKRILRRMLDDLRDE